MSDPLRALREHGTDPAAESRALGEWALEAAGLSVPRELIAVVPTAPLRADAAAPTWDPRRVPWARRAAWILVARGEEIELAPLSGARVEPGTNLAGEERDAVVLDELGPVARAPLGRDVLRLRGALVRAVQMAGALERICELSLDHARARRQFDRPIGSFQAVQEHLVTIAQQTALVSVAVEAAVARAAAFEIAVAKALAGRAAITAARAAHQVHGARGVTRAHPLSLETRRLWSWRVEYGSEREWSLRLGDAAARAGADHLYPAITGGSWELQV